MAKMTKEELHQWLNDGSVPIRKPHTLKKHDYLVRNAHFKLSAMGQKLVIYAFSLLPPITDTSSVDDRKVKFSYMDYCNAMGIEKSGSHLVEFKTVLNEILDAKVFLPNLDGTGQFDKYNWFEAIGYDGDETGLAYAVFTDTLIQRMIEAKYFYTPLILQEIGHLKGEYTIRYYELGKSHESEAGKYGNPPGKWSITFALSELRLLFGIEAYKYKKNGDFLIKVVDTPTNEINEAYFNFTINPQRIKAGRTVVAVKLVYATKTAKQIEDDKYQRLLLKLRKMNKAATLPPPAKK
jgi:plasmid replication initiation protein